MPNRDDARYSPGSFKPLHSSPTPVCPLDRPSSSVAGGTPAPSEWRLLTCGPELICPSRLASHYPRSSGAERGLWRNDTNPCIIVSRLDPISISAVVYSAGEHSLEGLRSGPGGNEGREMCIHIRVTLKSVVISKSYMQLCLGLTVGCSQC